jgi:hypothetical protein
MPTNKNPKQSLKKISAYEIVEIFKNQPGKVFTYQMLTKKLQLKAKEETLLKLSLEKLLDTGTINYIKTSHCSRRYLTTVHQVLHLHISESIKI